MNWPASWFNTDLAKQPLNWAIVWTFATLWLLAFHVIMQGYTAMTQGASPVAFNAPGQIATIPNVTADFSQPGNSGTNLSPFLPTGLSNFTDGYESKYAEDGWSTG